jgi:hypothetical protein
MTGYGQRESLVAPVMEITHDPVKCAGSRTQRRCRLQGGCEPGTADWPRVLGMVLAAGGRAILVSLSLSELFGGVRGRAERSRTRTVESQKIRVEASRTDAERLALLLPGEEAPLAPTHWSFGQVATMIGAPSTYLRQLPAPLAAINLQYGLTSHRAELIKTLEVENGRAELRAVTGLDYGRIFDHELVTAVQRIAGNGTGDTRWKIPGVLDWSTGIYNPRVDITKNTTTLYASDRDKTARSRSCLPRTEGAHHAQAAAFQTRNIASRSHRRMGDSYP